MSKMTKTVTYDVRGPVAWATLNRPEVLNAVNTELLQDLLTIVRNVSSDEHVRVLVLTGAGRAFCVGGDIKDMVSLDANSFRNKARLYQQLSRELRQLDKPVLAAINGYALGGGLELALMCDLRIAGDSAKFGLPDAQLGFSPTGGLTYLLTRVIGVGRTMHLALTCETIDADQAEQIGLVTRVVNDAALLDTMEQLSSQMAARPAAGLAYNKRGIYAASETSFMTTLALEEEYDVACFRSPETQQALAAFIESKKRSH